MGKKITIITLTYNNLENATKPFLKSLYEHTSPDIFELILVDNNSTDGTVKFLNEFVKIMIMLKLFTIVKFRVRKRL